MIQTVNLTAVRGDDFAVEIGVEDANGAPVDITGWTLFLTVKPAVDADLTDAAAVIRVTQTAHTDAAGGKSILAVDAADTEALGGVYPFDVAAKRPDGGTESLVVGHIEWIGDITRRTS